MEDEELLPPPPKKAISNKVEEDLLPPPPKKKLTDLPSFSTNLGDFTQPLQVGAEKPSISQSPLASNSKSVSEVKPTTNQTNTGRPKNLQEFNQLYGTNYANLATGEKINPFTADKETISANKPLSAVEVMQLNNKVALERLEVKNAKLEKLKTLKELKQQEPELTQKAQELQLAIQDQSLPYESRVAAQNELKGIIQTFENAQLEVEKLNDLNEIDKTLTNRINSNETIRQQRLEKEYDGLKNLVQATEKALVKLPAQLANMTYAVNEIGEAIVTPELAAAKKKNLREALQPIEDFANSLITQETPENYKDWFKGDFSGGKLSYLASEAIGQTIPTVAAGFLGGGAGALVAGSAMAFDESRNVLLEAGLSQNQADAGALALAVPLGLLEKYGISDIISKPIGRTILRETTQEVTEKLGKELTSTSAAELFTLTKKTLGTVIKKYGEDVLGAAWKEPVTEMLQAVVTEGGKQAAEAYTGQDSNAKQTTQDYLKETGKSILGEGLSGLLGGVGISAATSAFQSRTNPSAYARALELKDQDLYDDFIAQMQSEVDKGILTPEQMELAANNVKKIQEVDAKIPSNIVGADRRSAASSLLAKKEELETELEGKDKTLAAPIAEEINKIDQTLTEIAQNKPIDEIQEGIRQADKEFRESQNQLPPPPEGYDIVSEKKPTESTLNNPQVTKVDDGDLYEWKTDKGLIAGVMTSPTEFRIDGISANEVGKGQGSVLFENLINYLKDKGVTKITTQSAGEGAVAMHDKAVEKGLLKEISKEGRNATFEIVTESKNENAVSKVKTNEEKKTETPQESKTTTTPSSGPSSEVSAPNDLEDFTSKGGNKAVDQKGEPIIVYHATDSKEIEGGSFRVGTRGSWGEGVYFADSENLAKSVKSNDKANVVKANVSLKNPLVVTEEEYNALINEYGVEGSINRYLLMNGYDGAIRTNYRGGKEYFVLDPKQIQIISSNASKPLDTKTIQNDLEKLEQYQQDKLFNITPSKYFGRNGVYGLQSVAEAYVESKSSNSNLEFTKAVEDLLSPTTEKVKGEVSAPSSVDKIKEKENVRELNILGADIGFDKPQRNNYEEGKEGDLKYANDNSKHNEKVDKTILGLSQEGTLTDSQGKEYLVTITSQGVRVVNKLLDGTEGEDIYYRNGKRVDTQTPFTKGFSFKPNKTNEQPTSESNIPTSDKGTQTNEPTIKESEAKVETEPTKPKTNETEKTEVSKTNPSSETKKSESRQSNPKVVEVVAKALEAEFTEKGDLIKSAAVRTRMRKSAINEAKSELSKSEAVALETIMANYDKIRKQLLDNKLISKMDCKW